MKSIILNIVLDKFPREVVDKIEIDFNILKSICKPLSRYSFDKKKRRYIDRKLLDNLLLDGEVSMGYKLQFSYIKRDGILYEYPSKIILISDQEVNAPELVEADSYMGINPDILYIMKLIHSMFHH